MYCSQSVMALLVCLVFFMLICSSLLFCTIYKNVVLVFLFRSWISELRCKSTNKAGISTKEIIISDLRYLEFLCNNVIYF